jgi:hypothetical protein
MLTQSNIRRHSNNASSAARARFSIMHVSYQKISNLSIKQCFKRADFITVNPISKRALTHGPSIYGFVYHFSPLSVALKSFIRLYAFSRVMNILASPPRSWRLPRPRRVRWRLYDHTSPASPPGPPAPW